MNLIANPCIEILIVIVIIMQNVLFIIHNSKYERNFTIFYFIEMIIKVFAFGIWNFRNSYFKKGWNLIEFFVLTISFLKYFYKLQNIPDLSLIIIILIN